MIHALQIMLSSVLAQQEGTGGAGADSTGGVGGFPCLGDPTTLIMVLLMVGIMYFLMIRPQQKQQKQMRNMRESLKKDDRVVTTGGLHGVIVALKGDLVTLRIADGVKVDFDRSAIVSLDKHSEGE